MARAHQPDMGAVATNLSVVTPAPVERSLEASRPDIERACYERHAPAVLRRLWQLCGDRALAEDLTQDTFVVAFSRWSEFRGSGSRDPWLHGIAYNLLRDHRKLRSRRADLQARRCHAGRALPVQGEGQSSEDQEAQLAMAGQLVELLADMDPKFRDAFVLRTLEGLSLERVAAAMEIPVSTVSYRARRAETMIRNALGAEG